MPLRTQRRVPTHGWMDPNLGLHGEAEFGMESTEGRTESLRVTEQ